ncbi:MAG: penicillin-binding protein 2 [bacterium]|nr:penicillin-binding protein 2 [bacterium]
MIKDQSVNTRLIFTAVFFLLVALAIIIRLFILQIIENDYYSTFALSTHEIYKQLYPERGQIYFSDSRTGKEYPAAINRKYYLIYAVPKEIPRDMIQFTADTLIQNLKIEKPEEKDLIIQKLTKQDDPYEQIAKKIDDTAVDAIKEKKLTGIYFTPQTFRYYPEEAMGANILGFCRSEDNTQTGNYGIEGYWNKILAGKGGFTAGQRGAFGNWISLAGRTMIEAENGPDVVLTIDRTLEYQACEALRQGFEEHKAKSAALVMMNPETGAILAMCSFPDFNPNKYSEISDVSSYNNTTVFTPYEPGSVFKPITMAMALDLELISPQTTFTDPCVRKIDGFSIRNAEDKCYGKATMTNVLENSINTGVVFAEELVGRERFIDYVKKFGLGEKTGIELTAESPGNISALDKNAKIYGATASFGQGITVTPIQLATIYSAIASQGNLPKPYIVDEIRYPNGKVEKTIPQITNNIISARASKLLSGMLISVVENGHSKSARIPHYFIAGKTGTAQIAGAGGYTDETNHTFAGFAPAKNPKIVIIVKLEAPNKLWAESTATPIFRKVMDFTIKYFGFPEEK